jgi:hypothetical protein
VCLTCRLVPPVACVPAHNLPEAQQVVVMHMSTTCTALLSSAQETQNQPLLPCSTASVAF